MSWASRDRLKNPAKGAISAFGTEKAGTLMKPSSVALGTASSNQPGQDVSRSFTWE